MDGCALFSIAQAALHCFWSTVSGSPLTRVMDAGDAHCRQCSPLAIQGDGWYTSTGFTQLILAASESPNGPKGSQLPASTAACPNPAPRELQDASPCWLASRRPFMNQTLKETCLTIP